MFYRVQLDYCFLLVFEDDIYFNGDGNIIVICIYNGYVDYKQCYVRMDRFIVEIVVRKSLFGKYCNFFIDFELVKVVI